MAVPKTILAMVVILSTSFEPTSAQSRPGKGGIVLSAEDVWKSTSPSVIKIIARAIDGAESVGSGFVTLLDGKKVALTNRHVVQNGAKFLIEGKKVEEIDSSRVLVSRNFDLAVIHLPDGSSLVPLPTRKDPIRIGEKVYAIGHPRGLQKAISEGIINTTGKKHLVFSASISSGNSGGPLLDAKGTVVGLVTATAKNSDGVISQNYNSAIKIETVPSLDLFVPPALTFFELWRVVTHSETELQRSLLEFVRRNSIYASFLALTAAADGSEEIRKVWGMPSQLSSQQEERLERYTAKLFKEHIATQIHQDIASLDDAISVCEALKKKISFLDLNSQAFQDYISDSRDSGPMDLSISAEHFRALLDYSLLRTLYNFRRYQFFLRFGLHLFNKGQKGRVKLFELIFAGGESQDKAHGALSIMQGSPAVGKGSKRIRDRTPGKSFSEIDQTGFATLPIEKRFPPVFSAYQEEDLERLFAQALLMPKPLLINYKELSYHEAVLASEGAMLSDLSGMLEVMGMELQERGDLGLSRALIALNNSNRPYDLLSQMAHQAIFEGKYQEAYEHFRSCVLESKEKFDPFTTKTVGNYLHRKRHLLAITDSTDFANLFSEYPAPLYEKAKGWSNYAKKLPLNVLARAPIDQLLKGVTMERLDEFERITVVQAQEHSAKFDDHGKKREGSPLFWEAHDAIFASAIPLPAAIRLEFEETVKPLFEEWTQQSENKDPEVKRDEQAPVPSRAIPVPERKPVPSRAVPVPERETVPARAIPVPE